MRGINVLFLGASPRDEYLLRTVGLWVHTQRGLIPSVQHIDTSASETTRFNIVIDAVEAIVIAVLIVLTSYCLFR